ncbi:dephospho-CoA kinase [Maribacter sp. 2-571]|uniref:dephospho-CoA kinase n=1 Tax=Maribacter sp. 2-571 TaxID=3417569 RepID=UPI003D347B22
MKLIGLTGGIGSGKSTVAKMFADLGVPVYDSDREAKKLMRDSATVKRAIIGLFGEAAYLDERLNKKHIAEQVFGNAELLEKLNAIVHPAVREHFLQWASEQKTQYVIQETALIFENGMQAFYDATILAAADESVRIQRVMERDSISEGQVRARMEHQLDDEIKRRKADYVIENLDLEQTAHNVLGIHQKILGTL